MAAPAALVDGPPRLGVEVEHEGFLLIATGADGEQRLHNVVTGGAVPLGEGCGVRVFVRGWS